MTRTHPQATRLHAGRIVLVLGLLVGLAVSAWVWAFHRRPAPHAAVSETSTVPTWTAQQLHYEAPELKAQAPEAKPVDLTAAELARLKAMLLQMQAEMTELKNRKTATSTTVVQQPAKTEPVKKVPGQMLFVSHEVQDGPAVPKAHEYTLAPGATKLPCTVETAVNSDVAGEFTAKIATNVYDTATGRHLLVPQGSTILGRQHGDQLLYGNERLPTVSLLLTLPDGRTVDLGQSPITDQQGVLGLSSRVDSHFWRLAAAVFIGGSLRAGTQALQVAMADAAGAGSIAAGYTGVINQASSPRIGRALDTRPTIYVDPGSLCHVLLTKPLSLPALWE